MKKILSLLLALAMIATLMVACGQQEVATESPASETEQTSDDSQSAEPIKVGVLAVLTGDYATLGTTCNTSMQIALDEINAAGGVLGGRPIEFVTLDTTGDATEAVELARQLIEDEEIVAVLGPIRGAVEGFTVCPVTNEAELVTLLPIVSVNDFTAMGDYVFSMAGRQAFEMPHLAEAVLTDILDTKKIAVIYKNNEWGVSSVESLEAACEEQGIEIVSLEPYAESETDFTTVLTKMRQTDPEAVVLVSEAVDGAAVLTQMQQLGWDDVAKVGVGSLYSDQTLTFTSEGAAEGLITTTASFISEEDPELYAYAQEFEARENYPPTVHGPLSYDSVVMLASAIELAGSTDRTAIKDALFALEDVEGIAGTYTFTDIGDILRDYAVIKVEDGKFVNY